MRVNNLNEEFSERRDCANARESCWLTSHTEVDCFSHEDVAVVVISGRMGGAMLDLKS
jgi:hypothetical protein